MVIIGSRAVGPGHPTYIVAELSANHAGDFDRAVATIRAAADAGVDAIKLQTYSADELTIDCDREDFVIPSGEPWGGRTLYDLYREASTPRDWHETLFAAAAGAGIDVFSTPFDAKAVTFLEALGCPAYKIAAFELVDDGLLKAVAATGKPVILSTGMAGLEEITHAIDVLRAGGASDLVLLKCVSCYPAPDPAMNLAAIPALAAATGLPVGLSDHSLGITASIAAVALGACMIEKHFTIGRAGGGVDGFFSLEPHEMRDLVREVRRADAMRGSVTFGPVEAELPNLRFRRSLYVVADVENGEALTTQNVRAIRPGYGLAPRHLDEVLGKRAARALSRGTALRWEDVG